MNSLFFSRAGQACLRRRLGVLCFGLAALFSAAPALAQSFGDFTVSPTRVVFEETTRSETVALVNRSSETATFRVSMVHLRMTETGELVQLEELPPGFKVADELIRYAPRQIEIPPGGSQVVRLAVRKPADLGPGEYRSHLFFRAVPPESRGQNIETSAAQGDGGLQIQLIPIFGITIPVIVRHGNSLSSQVAMKDLTFEKEGTGGVLHLKITRQGNASAFGDITVRHIPANGQKPVVVAEMNRLAVYPEINARNVDVVLNPPQGYALSAGTLEVTYRSGDPDASVLANATIAIR